MDSNSVERFNQEESPTPRYAEWNESALARGTKAGSLAWRFQEFNLWALIVYLLTVLVFLKYLWIGSMVLASLGAIKGKIFFRKRPSRRVTEMQDPSSPIPSFPVDVLLYRQEKVYGEDHGIVSLVDGWLVYEGEDCSFSVKRGDASMVSFTNTAEVPTGTILVRCGCYPRTCVVGLRPKRMSNAAASEIWMGYLTARPDQERAKLERRTKYATALGISPLLIAVTAWLGAKEPVSGESIFPPIHAHPGNWALLGWARLLSRVSYVIGSAILIVGMAMDPITACLVSAPFFGIGVVLQWRRYKRLEVYNELRSLAIEANAVL